MSAANAKQNWQTENPGWNFNSVRRKAQAAWDHLLGKIRVSGGSYSQTQEFYSLLYKDFIQPNITSDVNGQFMGSDLKVHSLASGQRDQYGMYSGWDIYHSLAQLQALLDPQAASDMAQSQAQLLQRGQAAAAMGLRQPEQLRDGRRPGGLDHRRLLHLRRPPLRYEASADRHAHRGHDGQRREARRGTGAAVGYLPEDGTYGCCNAHGFMSTLLEYDNEDLALAQFATDMGDHSDASMLTRRANNWETCSIPRTTC